ncbi:hypothetical protein RCL06_24385, partial [Salmonella enterica subsp. enterica serovar Typhimurium]
ICILDAAAFHHVMQDRTLRADNRVLNGAEKALRRRKCLEIGLADLIVTCSALANDSYVSAGIDQRKIVINPLGCDTASFLPPKKDARI